MRRPLLNALAFAMLALGLCPTDPLRAGSDEIANGPIHEGVEVAIDLPDEDAQQNTGGTDGAGLCVFASLQMAARWQNVHQLADLFDFMKTQPGGGWPARVKSILDARAPGLAWYQSEGSDPTVLDLAIRSGRPVCITYGYGDFYRGKGVRLDKNGKPKIDHMVLLVHLDAEWGAIRDNNDPKHVTWMPRAELINRWKYPTGMAWTVVLLAPPAAPVPMN